MTITEIRRFPTTIDRPEIEQYLVKEPDDPRTWEGFAPRGWHESLLRSFQILAKVKELLELKTAPSVTLEIIAECEQGDPLIGVSK